MKTVLAIGGSDSAGCAGIQADIKTISALGLHAATALTSVTAQNTRGVQDFSPLPPATVSQQLHSISEDLELGAIKTGLFTDVETVSLVAHAIKEFLPPGIPLVVDPVICSSTEKRLLSPDAEQALLRELLPLATLVTPNAHEAAALCGFTVETPADAAKAGRALLETGCKSVLIKGGHFREETATDLLILPDQIHRLPAAPLPNRNTRGTGCSLASAIATLLAQGQGILEAVIGAKAFIYDAIRAGYSVGGGPGPINVLHRSRPTPAHYRPRFPGRFHAITDQHLQNRFTHSQIARMALQGGADVVQYRETAPLTTQAQINTGAQIKSLSDNANAHLIINDRTDVSLALGASGVHLGKNDLCPALARSILGPDAIIGRTANSLEEALEVCTLPVDYLGVGPVFGTTSKKDAPPALGLELFANIATQINKPVIAIGGIEPHHVGPLIDAGAYGIAVLSGLWQGDDPVRLIEQYRAALDRATSAKRVAS